MEAGLVILGLGSVGRELLSMVLNPASASRLRPRAVADSTALIECAHPSQAAECLEHKWAGQALQDFPRQRPQSRDWLLGLCRREPTVIVDCTASSDSGPLLAACALAGADLVLANKIPLSDRRQREAIISALAAGGTRMRASGTVGAGLPFLDTVRWARGPDDLPVIVEATLSGTLGFVLTLMGQGQGLESAVNAAQVAGYTEPDPRVDLAGGDVARKAAILAAAAGFEEAEVSVAPFVDGVSSTSDADLQSVLRASEPAVQGRLRAAQERGTRWVYGARVGPEAVRVGWMEVPAGSPLAGGGVQNVLTVVPAWMNEAVTVMGPGAGRRNTAAGMLSDIQMLLMGDRGHLRPR